MERTRSRGIATDTGATGIDVARDVGHPSARWGSIPAVLDAMAAERPDAPAVSFPSGGASYEALRASSVESARALRAAGIGPGDRVGVLLREACEPYVALCLGAMRLGAVAVPINARNKPRELRHVVRHAQMDLLLTAEEFGETVAAAEVAQTCPVVLIGAPAFAAAAGGVGADEVAALQADVGRDHVAQIVYTSGTTGAPKGCLHTHSTLLAEGENCAGRLEIGPTDRFWTPLPLFHCGGWQTLLAALSRGACFSHVGAFDGATALRQLVAERCTHAFPAFELIWADVLGQPDYPDADLDALRMIMNVGAPEHLLQMQERTPRARQVSCMGSTESCGSLCIGHADDERDSRMRTSGPPMPGAEIKVVDVQTRDEVPVGEVGEFLFRGVTLFAGYYRDEEATGDAMDDDGWFLSGDLVRREAHGGIAFVSRMKDMLKVGGENVAAGEIEGYLITHPAIAQVAVVGAPDRRYGEVAAAYVQLQSGTTLTHAEIVAFCLGHIASFKVPRYLRVVEDFPVTASQKVQKVALRERIAEELRRAGITEAPRIRTSRD